MSPFQMLLKSRAKVKNGKSPIPASIRLAFKNEALYLQRERVRVAIKNNLVKGV